VRKGAHLMGFAVSAKRRSSSVAPEGKLNADFREDRREVIS